MSAQQIYHNYRNNYFSQEVVDLFCTILSVWNMDSLFWAIAVSYWISGQLHTFLFQKSKWKMHGYVVVAVKGAWSTKSDMKLGKLRFSVFFFVQLLLFLGYGIERITVITSLSSWHIIITFYDPLFGFVVTFLFNVDSLQDFSPLYPTLVSRRKQVLGIQHVPLCKDYFHDTLF